MTGSVTKRLLCISVESTYGCKTVEKSRGTVSKRAVGKELCNFPCLTDKSEMCSPKSPLPIVFFPGKHFLEEERYGEHTPSL
jgi:hypothetical protein